MCDRRALAFIQPQHFAPRARAVGDTPRGYCRLQSDTKYLNQAYTVTREVRAPDGAVKVAADSSQLGELMIAATVLGLAMPFAAIWFARATRFKSAWLA